MKTMKPFISYYGGKWRIAKRYPAPTHNIVVEPFAGSAGYATRYHDKYVVLVEKNPYIASVWRYLIHATKEEIYSLPVDIDPGGLRAMALPSHVKSLIGFWLNHGSAAPAQSPSAWMRAGKHNSSFWGKEIRQRIAEQVPYIKHWHLIEGDYTLAPSSDECTWFIDPPYQRAGKHYMDRIYDYGALGAWCRSLKGQVIVAKNKGLIGYRSYRL
jgi:hypothetical protein